MEEKRPFAGKLIVLEGLDGSGKTTQTNMVLNRLKKGGYDVKFIHFPNYDSPTGKKVLDFLEGRMGPREKLDPLKVAELYINDFQAHQKEIREHLKLGGTVLLDRYYPSTMAYQTIRNGKFSKELFDAISEKIREKGLAEPHLVVYFKPAFETTRKLMKGKKLDIHERDAEYLKGVYANYRRIGRILANWNEVKCESEKALLPPEEIHENAWKKMGTHFKRERK